MLRQGKRRQRIIHLLLGLVVFCSAAQAQQTNAPSDPQNINRSTPPVPPAPSTALTVITPDGEAIPTSTPIPPSSGATAAPTAAPASGYQEPKLTPKPFDPDKVGLTAEQRSEAATQLAQAIRLIASKSPTVPINLATRGLGIALCLDPDNRMAVVSNLQMLKNAHFENIPAEPTLAVIAQNVYKTAQSLKDHADDDSRKLRGYLISLANEIDSSNEDLLYEEEMLRRNEGAPDWSGILGGVKASNLPSGPTVPKQLSLLCLMVSELDSGEMAGRATNLTATLTPTDPSRPTRVMVAGTVGKDMLTSFQETERAVKAQGTLLPPGADITISFGQKYSSKDGPSASAALGLLLMGLANQIQLDPQFAITGDMNVDGTIHAIGGVDAKIRGATQASCSRMGIPEENLRDLEDMAILQDLDTLWKTQVFTVKNLHEASILAAKEPGESLAKGMAAFAELQDFCRKNPQGTSYSNPFIRQKLAETLAATPNHASALVLQQYIDRKLPKTLSLRTSINEIFNAASPFFTLIADNVKARKSGGTRKSIFSFAPETYDKALDRLFALSPQIDPLAADLHAEVNNLIRNWRSASQRPYSEMEIKHLVEAADTVDYTIQKIRDDHNIQEILSK